MGNPSIFDQYERVQMETRAAWREWLMEHHETSPGIWLVTFKKGSGKPYLSYDDAVEEALCFGWIDSRPGKLDDERTMLLYTPRKKGSVWSASNKQRIERLMSDGQMMPAGLAKIEAAKADGSWTALDGYDSVEAPDDLRAAFAENVAAEERFMAFSPSARKQLLWWIVSAKRPETRQKRITTLVSEAAEGRNPLEWQAQQRMKRSP